MLKLAWIAVAVGLVLSTSNAAFAQTESDCEKTPAAQQFEKESAAQRAELVRINGAGTNQKLAQELMAMRATDQEIRNKIFALPEAAQKKLYPEMDKVDAQSTATLKEIVATYGWPTIALVGVDASQAALLLLIHSPDHAFQRELIPQLERLVEQKKIIGSDVAVLVDKELRAEGKLQRFGSQFSWKDNGVMAMDPVEDPARLEERRRMYLLPPLELYKCIMTQAYHRTVQ